MISHYGLSFDRGRGRIERVGTEREGHESDGTGDEDDGEEEEEEGRG